MRRRKLKPLSRMASMIYIQPPSLVSLSRNPIPPNGKLALRRRKRTVLVGGGVSDEEVKAALWSLKAYKAPRPDGLHVGFFQRFWLTVSKLMTDEVKRIFAERRMLDYLNKTHIAPIPKIQGPETLGNYRPISLYNSVYSDKNHSC